MQTDSERLQNFRPPAPPPTTYPNISGGDRGDPRFNINRDVSLGGNITRDSHPIRDYLRPAATLCGDQYS